MLTDNDKEKAAYVRGFSAGWEYKLGNKEKEENPFDIMRQYDYYIAWQNGFEATEDNI